MRRYFDLLLIGLIVCVLVITFTGCLSSGNEEPGRNEVEKKEKKKREKQQQPGKENAVQDQERSGTQDQEQTGNQDQEQSGNQDQEQTRTQQEPGKRDPSSSKDRERSTKDQRPPNNYPDRDREEGFDRHPDRLILTKHARCRMDCRHIDESEIREILAKGRINHRKSEPAGRPDPKYALEGTTRDGQEVRIIIADSPRGTVVVTVIDLENEWKCHCR